MGRSRLTGAALLGSTVRTEDGVGGSGGCAGAGAGVSPEGVLPWPGSLSGEPGLPLNQPERENAITDQGGKRMLVRC